MDTNETSTELAPEITPEAKAAVERWKGEEGNLIMVFHSIQDHYGYVPRNVAMYVAGELDVPLARIYEIITFYNFFNLEPPAEYTISVCTGTACYLKGADALIEEFKKECKIGKNEAYSEDKKYKVEEVRCLGCCGLAPVITVNGEIFGRVKADDVKRILEESEAKNA